MRVVMKTKMKRFGRVVLLLSIVLSASNILHAQVSTLWRPLNETEWSARGGRAIQPVSYTAYALDEEPLRAMLQALQSEGEMSIPLPEGGFRAFRIWPNGLMAPELAESYPEIRTFSGQATDDPAVTLRMDITPQGLRAMVMDPRQGDWFVDPYIHGQPGANISYRKKDFRKVGPTASMSCSYEQVNDVEAEMARTEQWIQQLDASRAGDCRLRTYRLALACTGEYANFHGSNTSNNNRSFALGAMVTTMNRVNAQFERDATLTMVLVANTDQLIYLNASTDPYTNNDGGAMLSQNQTACNSVIGTANYDIGHVFSTGGGGVAYLNSPCGSLKAGGVTGQSNPVGDPFDIDYVAHEMGHQFGANHTQNNGCNRASSAAFEPGSASTIMGYAGICAPNVQNNSDAYFHGHSMAEIAANINVGTSSSCPQTVTTINQAPTVNAGSNYTIPKSTPFVLTATGSDPNASNSLTYCWEQMNNQVSTQPPSASSTSGPNFRSVMPTVSPQRYFPSLAAIVANTTPTWEVLSSVARTFNFRVTARDNAASFGCNAQGNMSVAVAGNSGPFVVTQPNTAVSWTSGSQRTISWDVAGTTASPVSCSNVDILLSLDGGFTYPETLALATPNDGSQTVTMPLLPTTVATARVMVRGTNNIFFDISNTNFTITATPVAGYLVAVEQAEVEVCVSASATYSILTTSTGGYSQPITFSLAGLPSGLTAVFSSNPVTPGGSTQLTVSGIGAQNIGSIDLTLNAASSIGPKSEALVLNVSTTPGVTQLLTPLAGATQVIGGSPLIWTSSPYAAQHDVEIATNSSFSTIVESATGLTTAEYSPVYATVESTTYYWRVRGMNACGTGPWSASRSFTTAACVNVTVRITTDRYGDETTWRVVQGTTVYASGGPYARLSAAGSQVQTPVSLCLPEGCYQLQVFDAYGDGNCCAYGQGIITVENAETEVLASVSGNNFSSTQPAVAPFCVSPGIRLSSKLWLDGAYREADGLMTDALRVQRSLPLSEPYTALGFAQAAGGGAEEFPAALLSVTGNNAIVDWVRLELRSENDATQLVASRQALLQRDGDIVDIDGDSPVLFKVPQGDYFVVVRHRNHLGCMSSSPITFGTGGAVFDLQDPANTTYGTNARRVVGGTARLWNGNVVGDTRVLYTGFQNDRDAILSGIGGIVPTNTVSGYKLEDVNMDGVVKYTGLANDRDPILQTIGGIVPTSVRMEQLP